MGHGPENHSSDTHKAKLGELGRAYAVAVLSGDEIAAELAVRDAMDAGAEHRVLLATPAGELHVIALRMAGNLLREAGNDVVMLGADVPAHALAAAAKRLQPDVICLSTTMDAGDQVLLSIHAVQQQAPAVAFVVGGRGLTPRVRPRSGLDVCERVSQVVEAVDAAVKRADLN